MQAAEDFRTEVETLHAAIEPLSDADFRIVTRFKGWTIDDVIGHLHMFDVAAHRALDSREAFAEFFAPIAKAMQAGRKLLETQYPFLDGLSGRALRAAWRDTALSLAERFAQTDPKARLPWAGPDMSALSAVTARQMETWAHGQEVFDALGLERAETDRIRNICHLGVVTHGWTFRNRGLAVPEPAPFVELQAPSGAVWQWNEPQADNAVRGAAVEFAQVVTQVRNWKDTRLEAIGPGAEAWMKIAQCFAGPPEDPPAPGTRFREPNKRG